MSRAYCLPNAAVLAQSATMAAYAMAWVRTKNDVDLGHICASTPGRWCHAAPPLLDTMVRGALDNPMVPCVATFAATFDVLAHISSDLPAHARAYAWAKATLQGILCASLLGFATTSKPAADGQSWLPFGLLGAAAGAPPASARALAQDCWLVIAQPLYVYAITFVLLRISAAAEPQAAPRPTHARAAVAPSLSPRPFASF